jgi:hypothetical protein
VEDLLGKTLGVPEIAEPAVEQEIFVLIEGRVRKRIQQTFDRLLYPER